ncbi:hypothetical protein PGT21_020054 [Puccinia graminis f. sp. tritici]|uniref:NADH dehydrogenase [ubiquinone] 1 alpha subcomplex assembly factor 3 n=2 Tax=Puccinia graminis f. sp. tritici TaxID=56615 RepID=E3KBW1_PUCGT|nr:uncharacterized protein PGTG_08222 [Puccinia graminis f. sp. tritici CRL 75-36-700-3]EFP81973.1 hypothetical protein PGTG_08222 [Puccinia graminis f. sp. tritici CRL 75-36-700-3]KAA1117695.1 hypothetical protein PGT21_020054 [Puccinia graminis f. sp. tritici]KAA1138079.1 hypothetical protein PGTUg99_029008 [Puccinia graminis f. sp. tritici]
MQTVRRLSKSLRQVRQSSSSSQFTNIIQRADGERPGQAGDDEMLSVRSVHERAFTLSNDTVVPANLFLFNARGMLWNPARDIYPHPAGPADPTKIVSQFKLFEIIHPRPEMVILGAGKSILTIDPEKIAAIKSYLNSIGIQLDVLDTRNGCSNYNLLVEEGRSVAGLFLTLEPVDSISSQLLSSVDPQNSLKRS